MSRMLRKALEGVLSAEECESIFSSFDQIGDIIIIRIPDVLLPKSGIIGRTLLDRIKPVRSVYRQSSDVRGDHRIRDLELVAGHDSTLTEYRENGCRFLVDVREAFFSPRLSTERLRIAGQVQDGETITNMFAGIGMFSIVSAKMARCTVYSIDINPQATEMCRRNISLNKMPGRVIPVCGDAADVIRDGLADSSDRTLMLLPERSDEFLESAIQATKSGGTIHYYTHVHADSRSEAAGMAEAHYTSTAHTRSEILDSRVVRAVGPRYYQSVVDVKITKE